jgi:hypothetical protein
MERTFSAVASRTVVFPDGAQSHCDKFDIGPAMLRFQGGGQNGIVGLEGAIVVKNDALWGLESGDTPARGLEGFKVMVLGKGLKILEPCTVISVSRYTPAGQ